MLLDHLGQPIQEGTIVWWPLYMPNTGKAIHPPYIQYAMVREIKTNPKGKTIATCLPLHGYSAPLSTRKATAIGVRVPEVLTVMTEVSNEVLEMVQECQRWDVRYANALV
jgi:hypothetical protein